MKKGKMTKAPGSAFASGPTMTNIPSATPPSSEGQSSGKVQHMRSGQHIENMDHMPKTH